MKIRQITENKKAYRDLLLLADEQEDMVDRYLERGDMFVLEEDGVIAECVVTQEGDGVYELQNLAVSPAHQRQGYGKRLIEFLFDRYPDCRILYAGTGESPSTLPFYHACGFTDSHRIARFFPEHYDHPIWEDGVQLIDKIYLKKERP